MSLEILKFPINKLKGHMFSLLCHWRRRNMLCGVERDLLRCRRLLERGAVGQDELHFAASLAVVGQRSDTDRRGQAQEVLQEQERRAE